MSPLTELYNIHTEPSHGVLTDKAIFILVAVSKIGSYRLIMRRSIMQCFCLAKTDPVYV